MVDVAAYGAHPDDLELCIGGTLALQACKGYEVVAIDMTKGEMGTNGTPAERMEEARQAAKVLDVRRRLNLELPDMGIEVNSQQLSVVVESIRSLKPSIVLAPYWESHHPDHENTGHLLTRACFSAGLAKYRTQSPPFRPRALYYYALPRSITPSFIVDVTEMYEKKLSSIKAHMSQVLFKEGNRRTAVNDPGLFQRIQARDAYWGMIGGCTYGEAFYSKRLPLLGDLFHVQGGTES